MAIISQSVWGHVQRPWGYEVRVDFVDDVAGIRNEVLAFPREPSAKELDITVSARKVGVGSRIAAELARAAQPPEPTKEELIGKVAILEAQVSTLLAVKIAPKVVI